MLWSNVPQAPVPLVTIDPVLVSVTLPPVPPEPPEPPISTLIVTSGAELPSIGGLNVIMSEVDEPPLPPPPPIDCAMTPVAPSPPVTSVL